MVGGSVFLCDAFTPVGLQLEPRVERRALALALFARRGRCSGGAAGGDRSTPKTKQSKNIDFLVKFLFVVCPTLQEALRASMSFVVTHDQ
ncbi:MAG: hypothetical protein F6K28_11155 [Microcoleus sp. SIO2G3]|nr:hypothetical protein [Microcoleus sp. SIO2G3]